MSTQADQLLEAVERDLGKEDARWFDPAGYQSVALCVLDSVYSTGNRYSSVLGFLDDYRDLRASQGADANTDSASDLIEAIGMAGGTAAFADKTSKRWRTSTKPGAALKADAALDAAKILRRHKVETVADILDQFSDRSVQDASLVKKEWLDIEGQRSGLTWRYFLMLAKVQGVKADRMIVRYVSAAIGRSVSAAQAGDLIEQVAESMGTTPIKLDHAIWRKESGREIYIDPSADPELKSPSSSSA